MKENKGNKIISDPITASAQEELIFNNTSLDIDELISKIEELIENKSPYSVSKEIEELKSLFYLRLKNETKDKEDLSTSLKNTKQEDSDDKSQETITLHPLEIKFKQIYSTYKRKKFEFRKNREQEEKENLKIKKKIIKDIHKLTQEEESIKKTFENFRMLQNKWKNTGNVPLIDNNNLWQSYHHHVELFYDYIKINNDLRDLDFKRNLEEKNRIHKKAEALINEKSFKKVHDTLQELHEHWKNVGPVKRELREKIWERFQNISRILNKKRNDYFIEKKEEDKKKLKKKDIICKKIDDLTLELISSHNKWQETTNQCKELEVEWKKIGRLNKINNKIAWDNLRSSLNNFYNKKNAFYKQRKEEVITILKKKNAICEEAELLQNSTDWKVTGDKIIKLQNEWKNTAFSPPGKSNKIWKRFKRACDTFFKNRKSHYKTQEKKKEICFKKKEELLNELKKFKKSVDPKGDIKQLKEFRDKWKKIGNVPINKIIINDEFFSLINIKFKELGLNKEDLATEQYKNKVNSLKGNAKALNYEKQFMKSKIDSLRKDIIQYENNMSFFGNNKETQPLRKQIKLQIKKVNTEIKMLKQKIKILNKG